VGGWLLRGLLGTLGVVGELVVRLLRGLLAFLGGLASYFAGRLLLLVVLLWILSWFLAGGELPSLYATLEATLPAPLRPTLGELARLGAEGAKVLGLPSLEPSATLRRSLKALGEALGVASAAEVGQLRAANSLLLDQNRILLEENALLRETLEDYAIQDPTLLEGTSTPPSWGSWLLDGVDGLLRPWLLDPIDRLTADSSGFPSGPSGALVSLLGHRRPRFLSPPSGILVAAVTPLPTPLPQPKAPTSAAPEVGFDTTAG